MEEVSVVEDYVVVIRISPTTHGEVLIYERFIGISAVPIRLLFREMVKEMLVTNTVVQRLVADVETMVHVGHVAVAEEDRSKKLKLIGQNPAVEDVVTEDVVHRIDIALEEDRIDS